MKKMNENEAVRICKRCPNCGWRLFDKVTVTTGRIEIKCPQCRTVVEIDLAYRRTRRSSDWQPARRSAAGIQ